jgi:hypothetical protein
MSDCKLNQEAQIDMSISKKRRSQAKKITGFQVLLVQDDILLKGSGFRTTIITKLLFRSIE